MMIFWTKELNKSDKLKNKLKKKDVLVVIVVRVVLITTMALAISFSKYNSIFVFQRELNVKRSTSARGTTFYTSLLDLLIFSNYVFLRTDSTSVFEDSPTRRPHIGSTITTSY